MAQRLFPTVIPSHYTLSLKPNLTNFTFTGEETITFTIGKASDKITFHAYELQITNATLHDGEKDFVPEIAYDEKNKTVTFAFPEVLQPGEKQLILSFTGVLNKKMKGFYRSQYQENGETKYMAVTQFEEIGARQALVCIDEPAAKAVFDISLIVPKNLIAISNTKEESVEEKGDEKNVRFSPTPRMSTYLLAFIVGDLASVQAQTPEGVTIRAFSVPEKKQQLQFALDVAVKVLSFYSSYFNIPYPLPILDIIAIPDFDAGAMENWGAVTFREAALLIDPEKSSLTNKQWVALVVAHEFAHMWFGNLVTMQWWNHLWLNEGFACYIEYLAVDALFPEWNIWQQFAVMEHNGALSLDSLKNTHPIEVAVKNEEQIKEAFDEISYAKGASAIQMIATFLGADIFQMGLQRYLKKHAYTNTVTEDLWDSLEEVSKQHVRKIMSAWTQQPGYPVVFVDKNDTTFSLTQKRFFSNPAEHSLNERWIIPMRYCSDTDKDSHPLLIEGESQQLLTQNDWIKINAGETSVMRGIYSQNLYNALGKAIRSQQLNAIDRMGIIRDAFDGAEAGITSVTQALQLLPNYQDEKEYIVWSTIASGLGSLGNIIHHIPEIQENFQEYAKNIFTSLVEYVGWDKRSTDSSATVLLRSTTLYASGKYGNKEVIAKAHESFNNLIEKHIAIDSDIRGVVYNLVSRNGGRKEWDELVSLYNNETQHQEKNRILIALCAFKQPHLIQRTLEWSISGKIKDEEAVRLQDKSRVILAMFGNPYAQEATWNFVKEHWEYFVAVYRGLHGFGRVIEGAGNMIGKAVQKEVQKFFKEHYMEELQRTMNQVVERIEANTAWLEREKEALQEFFSS